MNVVEEKSRLMVHNDCMSILVPYYPDSQLHFEGLGEESAESNPQVEAISLPLFLGSRRARDFPYV